ncbi:MAG: AAA family ATPase [Brooklawnia sp.]|jgi:hypothetical protein
MTFDPSEAILDDLADVWPPDDPGQWPTEPPFEPPAEDEAERTDRARRMFPRLDWHALWADDTEEEWIHYPLLPARRSVVIYSAPKVGKSLLALELAVILSRGEAFLGHKVERRYRVLYIDFENDPRGDVRSRLQAMGYGPDDLDHLDYLSFPTMAGLDTERGALELLEATHAYGSEIVIIDTVSRAVVGEENSNDTWLGLYRRTGLRLKQAGISLVRLDHTGKDETKGQRGGSAKSGDVDAIWRLTRLSEDQFKLECTDARVLLEAKLLRITRHTSPRLHHSVDDRSFLSERDLKLRQITELADANGLARDASRREIQALARARGIKARSDVYNEVAKARKASFEWSPKGSPHEELGDQENWSPTAGDHNSSNQPDLLLTTQNTGPHASGTTGDQGPKLVVVPVSPSIDGDRGPQLGDQDRSEQACTDCRQPLNPALAAAGETRHPSCGDPA